MPHRKRPGVTVRRLEREALDYGSVPQVGLYGSHVSGDSQTENRSASAP